MYKIGDIFYRYEDQMYANACDEWGESTGSHMQINLYKFSVVKVTPKGVRLSNGRVVLNETTKRFALPTLEEALESFKIRKRIQYSIYMNRAKRAEMAINFQNNSYMRTNIINEICIK